MTEFAARNRVRDTRNMEPNLCRDRGLDRSQ
jgi:hypothetical protein